MSAGPYERPPGTTDETVTAVGKVTEAFEWLQRARGHLYELHQVVGHADGLFGEAAEELRAAGHHDEAELIERDVMGRNVLEGRWTFQMIDEAEELFFRPVGTVEQEIRSRLLQGRRHVLEAEMKVRKLTAGAEGQRPWPPTDE